MLQCPFCLVVGLEGDRTCYKCGRPYRPGITQRGLSMTLGVIFAATMLAAIFLIIPPSFTPLTWLASVITIALMTGGAWVSGSILGWIIGAFVCEC